MKLTELNPRWMDAEHDNKGAPAKRTGIGVLFDCPCGCGESCYIPFANPLDGGPAHDPSQATWQRIGDTFESLNLTPSILRRSGCKNKWHGYIRNGDAVPC